MKLKNTAWLEVIATILSWEFMFRTDFMFCTNLYRRVANTMDIWTKSYLNQNRDEYKVLQFFSFLFWFHFLHTTEFFVLFLCIMLVATMITNCPATLTPLALVHGHIAHRLQSVKMDREAWWNELAGQMEVAAAAGNIGRMFKLIRNTGGLRNNVSEKIH